MLLIAKIARAHPRIRHHLEGMLKELWLFESASTPGQWERPTKRYSISWRRVRPASFASIWQTPRAQTNSMRPFPAIARTFGKSALDYARERELVAQTG